MNPRLLLLLLLSFFFFHFSFSQTPGWISYDTRIKSYPADKYLTGFSSQVIRKTDNLEEVKKVLLDNARTQLTESISISIKSAATLNVENRNSKTLEIFKQASTSVSQADLTGLKTEEYYDPKKKEAFAFVWLNKAEYLNALKNLMASEADQLAKKLESARTLASSGNKEQALKRYYSAFADLRAIEGKLAIVLALGSEGVPVQVGELETKAIEGVASLQKSKHETLEELCFFLADGMKQQLSETDRRKTIRSGSFTYMDTRMGSDFAVQLKSSITTKMVGEGLNVSASESGDQGLIVEGTYWPAGNSLKVIVNVCDMGTGKILASTESFLPLMWLEERKIAYLPDNYQAALELEKELAQGQFTGDGLTVKLWTNKGNTNPVFKNDEIMKVWIQVNQPCFVRLIYYLADGKRVLLLDSRHIDEEKVNKPYELPGAFQCAKPFGSEVLQMVCQTEQFKPLNLKPEDGYDFIIDSDKAIIATTRGMKKEKPALLMAEKRINITTVEK